MTRYHDMNRLPDLPLEPPANEDDILTEVDPDFDDTEDFDEDEDEDEEDFDDFDEDEEDDSE